MFIHPNYFQKFWYIRRKCKAEELKMSSQKTMTNFFSVKRKPTDQHPSKRRKAVVQDDAKETKVFIEYIKLLLWTAS